MQRFVRPAVLAADALDHEDNELFELQRHDLLHIHQILQINFIGFHLNEFCDFCLVDFPCLHLFEIFTLFTQQNISRIASCSWILGV